ncbi:MAG: ABC transporter permease [Desulfocapsaceae bacterium]|nr:ABC transporter permease [Desulfocapsaceae bacterium]
MRPADTIVYAMRSLGSNTVRTVLMLLAMSIGVASVVLLTGIGNGARLYIVDQFSSLGTNLVIIIPGRAETASNTPATLVGQTPRELTLDDMKALQHGDMVGRIAPLTIGELNADRQGKERQVPVLGSTASMLDIHHLKMESGTFLPDEGADIARPVCVIGAKLYQELFGQAPALNEVIRLGGFRCRVIGILASQGRSLGFDTQEMVVVPVAFAQMIFDNHGLFRILVEAKDQSSIDRLKHFISRTIKKLHYGEEDITIITQDSVLKTFDKMLRVLTLTVGGIAAISLFVAGILIMNVMLMSVAQRTAEIGLCKALGASNFQIMALLVSEALLLSAIGGLSGILLGFAGAWITVQFYPTLQTTPPFWAVAAAMATALSTGLLFSLLPARRAACLDPIQALARH